MTTYRFPDGREVKANSSAIITLPSGNQIPRIKLRELTVQQLVDEGIIRITYESYDKRFYVTSNPVEVTVSPADIRVTYDIDPLYTVPDLATSFNVKIRRRAAQEIAEAICLKEGFDTLLTGTTESGELTAYINNISQGYSDLRNAGLAIIQNAELPAREKYDQLVELIRVQQWPAKPDVS
jgi:hypothetical protein